MIMCSLYVPEALKRPLSARGAPVALAAALIVSALVSPVMAQQQTAPGEQAPTAIEAPEVTPITPVAPDASVAAPTSDATPGQPQTSPSAPSVSPTPSTDAAAPAAGAPLGAQSTGQPTTSPMASEPPASASDQSVSPGPPTELPDMDASAGATTPEKAPHLPHDLSPWGMFMQADWVVKSVMIGLAFASVVTWTVWLAKSLELTWAKRRLSTAFSEINGASTLAEAAQRLGGKKGIVSRLIELAAIELHLSSEVSDKAGIKERVSSRLDGLAAAAGRDMNRGTGVLATIGSTSPFVGLFGTVWGIMNSFIGISEAQTTNLAIVAPGIAEALLATAIGLVAAIPAVIIYNQFARQIGGYRAMINDASAEVMRLVSRDLDRGFKVVKPRAAE
jgi:biopolymer transport protein ExbB